MPKCDFNKLVCNFLETALRHGYSPVNLLHIFKTPFLKNTSVCSFNRCFHGCSLVQLKCSLVQLKK